MIPYLLSKAHVVKLLYLRYAPIKYHTTGQKVVTALAKHVTLGHDPRVHLSNQHKTLFVKPFYGSSCQQRSRLGCALSRACSTRTTVMSHFLSGSMIKNRLTILESRFPSVLLKIRNGIRCLLGICIFILSYEAQAKTLENTIIIDHQPENKARAIIGLKSQNRINFENHIIKEVIGDSNLYQIIHDSQSQNIFIIPKNNVGEIIEITIITNNNKIQDLSLKIVDEFGKIILIKSKESIYE